MITGPIKKAGRSFIDFAKAPMPAKIETIKDFKGVSTEDPGAVRAIEEAIMWLKRAQDKSASNDGGVARHYNLLRGWGPSYPETTGYIIPTIIRHAKNNNDTHLMNRAERMLDWLVSIQLPEGSFQGGVIGVKPITPVTFNTGQILLGLAEGVRTFGEKYKKSMQKAADWLVETQDDDGCWRKFPTPFAEPGEKTYETHVAWGLFEAAAADGNEQYYNAAMMNNKWALKYQNKVGWFDKCCLVDPLNPLTHTLGYVFRGILEAYKNSQDDEIFLACKRMADGLLTPLQENGFLAGRLSSEWKPYVAWSCLTGTVQIAYCWFSMYQFTGKKNYLNAAKAANRYVRQTQKISGNEDTRGGIKGSFPVYGGYSTNEFLNWAAKFFIDSNALELEVCQEIERKAK